MGAVVCDPGHRSHPLIHIWGDTTEHGRNQIRSGAKNSRPPPGSLPLVDRMTPTSRGPGPSDRGQEHGDPRPLLSPLPPSVDKSYSTPILPDVNPQLDLRRTARPYGTGPVLSRTSMHRVAKSVK